MTIEDAFLARMSVGLKTALSELGEGDPASSAGSVAFGTPAASSRRLLVALSGGPDSTAMALALHLLSASAGLELHVAHVNHKLRGADSEGDQAYCQSLCQSLSLPFTALVDGESGAGSDRAEREPALPAEAKLRDSRYRLLGEAARASSCEVVVVGHTLDDQLETVLFRLFRGSSLGGLTGMKPLTRLAGGIKLIRPMLSMRRLDCLEFLEGLKVEARLDLSNADQRYARNYVRHSIFPVIEQRFPHVRIQLERFRQRVDIEDDFLRCETERLLDTLGGITARRWSLSSLTSEHPALAARVLARALEWRGIEVTFERVEAIRALMASAEGPTSSVLTLDKTWDVARQGAFLVFRDRSVKPKRIFSESGLILRLPGATPIIALGKALRIEEIEESEPSALTEPPDQADSKEQGLHLAEPPAVAVDLSAVRLPMLLRHRRPGDLMRPLGMKQMVSLKKYMHTHKRPDWFFDHWLSTVETMVVADKNEVLWVPSLGISERLRVTKQPTHRLYFVDLDQHVTSA